MGKVQSGPVSHTVHPVRCPHRPGGFLLDPGHAGHVGSVLVAVDGVGRIDGTGVYFAGAGISTISIVDTEGGAGGSGTGDVERTGTDIDGLSGYHADVPGDAQ